MKTTQMIETLQAHEAQFGSIEIRHNLRDDTWTANLTRTIESRGNGLRTSVGGFGKTEEEAIQGLWESLTIPNSFFSIAQYGQDSNYGWTGNKFVALPLVSRVGFYGVLDSLRSHIPDLPAAY